MKRLRCLLTWLSCFVFAATVYSETVQDLVAKGCPSPDREWQAKDYAVLHQLLAKGGLPLLRLNSEPSCAVFQRLVNVENLSLHQNKSLPLKSRIPDLMDLVDFSNGITKLYLRALLSGEKVEREMAELLVFQLAATSVELELFEEFIPTIPKDQSYEGRMAGLAEAKKGLVTMLDGTIISLSERSVYSDESIISMVKGLSKYYLKFESIIPASVKLEFCKRVDSLIQKENKPAVKQELEAFRKKMKTQ